MFTRGPYTELYNMQLVLGTASHVSNVEVQFRCALLWTVSLIPRWFFPCTTRCNLIVCYIHTYVLPCRHLFSQQFWSLIIIVILLYLEVLLDFGCKWFSCFLWKGAYALCPIFVANICSTVSVFFDWTCFETFTWFLCDYLHNWALWEI